MVPLGKLLRFIIIVFGSQIGLALAQAPEKVSGPMLTRDRLEESDWWPTKGRAARTEYVGREVCKECHPAKVNSQKITPMFRASSRAIEAEVLQQNSNLTFREGGYEYVLRSASRGSLFLVRDRCRSLSATVAWAFGASELGQTYILEESGTYLESRLSFYRKLQALDITIGHSKAVPTTLESALGHELDADTIQKCFGCHTTAATISNVFDPKHAEPGVQCEACHGPGVNHVAAMHISGASQLDGDAISPGRLSPVDSVDFCGACHRTFMDVALGMPGNDRLINVRFQPYRLEKSRCWNGKGDPRITCIACHDPHQLLVRDVKAYDSKCLACHSDSAKGGPEPRVTTTTCKISTKNCASCHMPKYEIKQMHGEWTDHFIRVVRPGAGFPP